MLLERPLAVGRVAGHEEVRKHEVRRAIAPRSAEPIRESRVLEDIVSAERLGEPRHDALPATGHDPPELLYIKTGHVGRRVRRMPRALLQAVRLGVFNDLATLVWQEGSHFVDGAVLVRQLCRVAHASLDSGDGLGRRRRGPGPPPRYRPQEREAVLGLVERDDRVLVRVGGRASECVQQRRHRGLVA